jgi:hypothetical protein
LTFFPPHQAHLRVICGNAVLAAVKLFSFALSGESGGDQTPITYGPREVLLPQAQAWRREKFLLDRGEGGFFSVDKRKGI